MFESYKLKKEQQKYSLERVKLAMQQLQEASNYMIKDPDEDQFKKLGGEKEFSEGDIQTLQTLAYKYWKENPHARGIIRTLEKFVLGTGIEIKALDENEIIQQWWDEFEQENKFSRRQDEIIRRVFRDGECFIRYFLDENTGKMRIRFIDPDQINDPEQIYSYGIETDPDDIEIPLNYIRAKDGRRIETIPAAEIQHIKIFADSNVKRGISFLYHLMERIKDYEKWLNDRIVLNKVRTAVAIIKTVSNPEEVKKLVAEQQSTKRSGMSGRTKMLKPGTIITAGEGIKYEFLEPKLQAQDVAQDGKTILLQLAVGSGLPEYIITGDASNANYASQMVAESPAIREFEDWQEFFKFEFQTMFRKVIQAGIDYGSIPAKSTKTTIHYSKEGEQKEEQEIQTNINCDIQFPILIHRNIKEETDSIIAAMNAGLISPETAAAKLGYDYDKEQKEIEKWEIKQQGFEKDYEQTRAGEIKKEDEPIPEG